MDVAPVNGAIPWCRLCYEASYVGLSLQRDLHNKGAYDCVVVASSGQYALDTSSMKNADQIVEVIDQQLAQLVDRSQAWASDLEWNGAEYVWTYRAAQPDPATLPGS